MLYGLSDMAYNAVTPMRLAARATRDFWHSPFNPAADTTWGRSLYATSCATRATLSAVAAPSPSPPS